MSEIVVIHYPWRKRSSVPPLPDEWLVSLFDYRFYRAGQKVALPTMDSLFVSCKSSGSKHGVVMRDTLFDENGRVILPDHEVDWLKSGLQRKTGSE